MNTDGRTLPYPTELMPYYVLALERANDALVLENWRLSQRLQELERNKQDD